jgi:hypothetical protein
VSGPGESVRLEAIDRDLWIVDGPSVRFLGVPYPTRMTIVRLRDGRLWICSPIELTAELAAEVDALGRVGEIVSPNKIHHLRMGEWARRWPAARLWASPGLARRRPDLSFHGDLGDEPAAAWAEDIDQVVFHGSFALEEVVFFHRASRTAIFTDLMQKFDPSTLRGWRKLVMRLDTLVGPDGSTPREWRLSFWNRAAARRALQKALAWDPQRLIIAHGDWVRRDGREVLAKSLAWI